MKKDITRDYATDAFRLYAALGKPSSAAALKSGMCQPLLLDVSAVNETIKKLIKDNKGYIVKAVEGVYFNLPDDVLRKGDISMRVIKMARELYATEDTVYKWLREARTLFSIFRGLRHDEYRQYIGKTSLL